MNELRISLSGAAKILTLASASLHSHWKKYFQGEKSSLCEFLINQGYSQELLKDIHNLGLTMAQFKDVISYYYQFGRVDKNRDTLHINKLNAMTVSQLTQYVSGLKSPRKLTDYTVTVTMPINLKRSLKQKSNQVNQPVNQIILDLLHNHFATP